MIHFITHCDDNYLPQARVMLESLYRHASEEISGHIVCLGSSRIPMSAYPNFGVYGLDFVLGNFPELEEYKRVRTHKEFCWAVEPALCLAAVQLMRLEESPDLVVYVDADSYFFADPVAALRCDMMEIDYDVVKPAVGLTPHHFPTERASKADEVGTFNFGFGAFTPLLKVEQRLREWFDLILKTGSGTAGQKHLDTWLGQADFQVVELRRGFNVGPWQLAEIDRAENDAEKWLTIGTDMLISYHFHEFRRCPGRNTIAINGVEWNRTNYDIHPSTVKNVYEPYEAELAKWIL